jgi:hypothetical protein
MTNFPDRIELNLNEMKKSSIFNIHLEQKPSGLTFNGTSLHDATDFHYDAETSRLTAKLIEIKDGVLVIRK